MARTIAIPKPTNTAFTTMRLAGLRATWSRAISARADVKLAPSMVRPNLFSGD